MKYFRRLPAPPVNDVWHEIEARQIGFSAFVFWVDGSPTYRVTLRFEREKIDCKVEGDGRTFDEALGAAWGRWPRA